MGEQLHRPELTVRGTSPEPPASDGQSPRAGGARRSPSAPSCPVSLPTLLGAIARARPIFRGGSMEAAEGAGHKWPRHAQAQGKGRGSPRHLTARPASFTVLDDREFLGHFSGSPGTLHSLCPFAAGVPFSCLPAFYPPTWTPRIPGLCVCAPGRQAHVACKLPEFLGSLPGTADSETEGPGPPLTRLVTASQLRARPRAGHSLGVTVRPALSRATQSGSGRAVPAELGLLAGWASAGRVM